MRGRPRSGVSERVASLAQSGLPARYIAERLGVTTQRVYRVAKRDGIKLPRASDPRFARQK